jgi:hypothetical protein
VKVSIRKRLADAKRRIERRLDRPGGKDGRPLFGGQNVRYEYADRVRGITVGGIGLVHRLAEEIGLVDAINRNVHVLKVHLPYHESDHVLNLAYNALCEGVRLEDIELRRNDEVYLDALGTDRIPDPTTAGDFCRRFSEGDVRGLVQAIDAARRNVWARQPKEFFSRATIDADGTRCGPSRVSGRKTSSGRSSASANSRTWSSRARRLPSSTTGRRGARRRTG